MSAEPRHQREPAAGPLPGSGTAGSGATSPLRVLLVIVPLLVIAAVGTNLLGLWTTPYQQAAREKQVGHRQPEREVIGGVAALAPPGHERCVHTQSAELARIVGA